MKVVICRKCVLNVFDKRNSKMLKRILIYEGNESYDLVFIFKFCYYLSYIIFDG